MGAGVIIREKGQITGLTTASVIWLVAALGVGLGIGQYLVVFAGTILSLLILWGVPRLDIINKARSVYTYEIEIPNEGLAYTWLITLIKDLSLSILNISIKKSENRLIFTYEIGGQPDKHEIFVKTLMKDPKVEHFEVF